MKLWPLRPTVRWRLTLLYGGLFLVCGAGLLAINYTLVANATVAPVSRKVIFRASPLQIQVSDGAPALLLKQSPPPNFVKALQSPAGGEIVHLVGKGQRGADLHQLIVESAIALAIMAILSALLGWVVAGRVLAPLRTITATTQQISEANLHQRLALPGPRDELRRLADTIDGVLERLERAFDAQRQFVANASHELRTPLTSARALLEMAISDPAATVTMYRETCEQALEETEQQEHLIDALLALAQGQRGIDRREPIDLATVTQEVLAAHEPAAAESGLSVEASLEPARIRGDRRLIERLVSNLLQNAVRHNIPGGRISLAVRLGAEHAVLTVDNTGPPVPAEEIGRLLQPFQRLAPQRVHRPDGLGLGLSIVLAIATAHDAAIDIRPGAEGGLHVEVRFATARDAQPAGVHEGLPRLVRS